MHIFSFFKQLFYKQRLKKSRLVFPIRCKAHGVSSLERQGALAQSRKKDRLQLVHCATDGYPFNVYIYNIELNRIIGYLEEVLAEKLVYVFGKGFCLDGSIIKLTGGKHTSSHNKDVSTHYIGCNLEIYDTASMMESCEDFSHLHS